MWPRRFMETGQQTSRVGAPMTRVSTDSEPLGTVKRRLDVSFSSSTSCLLIEDLGRIGRAVPAWMVDHRESVGRKAELVAGDTAKIGDVERSIAAETLLLEGAVRMSMVAANENYTRMSHEEWNALGGARTQEEPEICTNASVAAGVDLDFFLILGSVSNILGRADQVNYASKSSSLGTFARYRNGLGLSPPRSSTWAPSRTPDGSRSTRA
ncbi:hypothetical protein MAPG_05312 [Magnaporthiopsis poae ATCC 64411]|uniref:Ketoreductase (KR) domain-containing protein n=1 Tax=Magnaporthiopsis poae (strain ATCC 64411 / 73-15) TaxID=644358 RepID=A0A0C4DZ24_MAGP6|nr:hypothetical protein MAPG_05312 [Magnaporthiopsis poae ATCC 64411]